MRWLKTKSYAHALRWLLLLLSLTVMSSVTGCKTTEVVHTPCPRMTDDAVCHWLRLRDGGAIAEQSALNFWMGQLINHCAWDDRDVALICPVHVPEPKCPK